MANPARNSAGKPFTTDHVIFSAHIAEEIGANAALETDDLDHGTLKSRGGLPRALALFGKRTPAWADRTTQHRPRRISFAADIDDLVAANQSQLLGKHRSWVRVRLREVATVLNGFPFESSRFSKSEGTPLIRIRDIVRGRTETFYQGDIDETFLVQRGEIVVGMDGDFNCAVWAGERALLNQRVCKITPDERFYSPRFLLHALPGYLAAINAHTSSITVKHLSSRTVEDIPLPLAPRAEQERIVSKLDASLSRIAAGEAAARRALERLKRYRAAVLQAAVTGELTHDWRKTQKSEETGTQLVRRLLHERRVRWEEAELKRFHAAAKPPKDDKWKKRYPEPTKLETTELPSLPRGWAWASLQQIGFIVGSLTKNPKRAALRLKMPYLRVGNVYANELRLDEVKTIGVEKGELEKLLLEKGDLLVVEGNGSKDQIGRVAIWDS